MASFMLRPPNFRQPEEWKKWLKRFEQFESLPVCLQNQENGKSAACCTVYMGNDAMDVLATTNISDGDKKDYSKVVKEFNEYFIFECANFNLASQLADETAEQFITRLHQMANNCKFGNMRSEIICDPLVIGIQDQPLSEKLQMEPELTLAKAEKLICQRAAVMQQQHLLKSLKETSKPLQLESARATNPTNRKSSGRNRSSQMQHAAKCRRCGKDSHPIQQCPACDVQCQKCKRKGHFTSKCLSKTVAEITMQMDTLTTTGESTPPDDPNDSDNVFINKIDGNTDSKDFGTSWNVAITIANTQISFKVDTGAELTAISESAWLNLKNTYQLSKT